MLYFHWIVKIDGKPYGVNLSHPCGNLKEDEAMVRYMMRKHLGLKRLPKGTVVEKVLPIS